jgi:hypothetical protein
MKFKGSVVLLSWTIALGIAAIGTGLREAHASADTELTELDRQVPFALSIRGGVSLGSYESGFNWALLQYLKKHRAEHKAPDEGYITLEAASGASAGSINALISTISWCINEKSPRASELFPDNVSDNLIRDTWLDMGFEELLPKEVNSPEHYRADDGVLTRNAFRKSIGRIEHLLGTSIFRPGCEVRLGVLVTRVDPVAKDIAGVRVFNQRFVIPLLFRVSRSGYGAFLSCLVDDEDPAFGNVMYLQGTRTDEPECPVKHSTDDIIDAIEASSAFPLAFGRKHIKYCVNAEQDENLAADANDKCPDGMQPVIDEFIDGGLFDNIPLGAARALAEPQREDGTPGSAWEKAGRRFNYIYLDPTIRRFAQRTEGHADSTEATESIDHRNPDTATYGIRSQLRFLGGAITSGRDYELYNLLRGGDWTSQVFTHADKLSHAISVRFPDITLDQAQFADLLVTQPVCEALFDRKWESGSSPDRDLVAKANRCIAASTQLLELQYRGTPIEEELKSADDVTRKRNALIGWIVKLAEYVGEDKLALSADQARNDKLGDRRILLSSRFSPVIGEMMQAFGAFVDRSFREYDYYAGIYDAVWGIANFVCGRHFDQASCLPAQIRSTYLALRVAESPEADTVFRYLLEHEFGAHPDWASDFEWANTDTDRAPDRNMLAIANSLFAEPVTTGETAHDAPSMTAFIRGLIDEDYDASESSRFLRRIFKLRDEDELTWYYPLSLRASNRLLLLEQTESKARQDGEIYVQGLVLGAFYLHSYMREEELTLNVSTAPDFSWQAWLPDEIAIDARNGGLDLSWYQGHNIGKKGWRWDAKFTPIQLDHSASSRDDNIWFSQADFLISRKTHGGISAVGFGPSVNWTWKEWPDSKQLSVGAAFYVGFVEDKLRLTIGKMSFRNEFPGGEYYVNIGVNDVPGLVYWGFPQWRGSWWSPKSKW